MSNFICSECGMTNIDCGYAGYKTPKEIEQEHQIADISKTIERLQEQLNEANNIIISVAAMPRFPVNPELCREYLKKWGVK